MLTITELPDFTFVSSGQTPVELKLSTQEVLIRSMAGRFEELLGDKKRVGLIQSTCPELILSWLSLVHAGYEPCILNYPTAKLTHEYWRSLIRHTVESCAIEALIAPRDILEMLPLPVLRCEIPDFSELLLSTASGPFVPPANPRVLQLSSGTTGFKKGVEIDLRMVRAHAEAYHELKRDDVVVSWLPLYHDMGFIACFLTPLIVGCKVVLMDPMDWIRSPELLFDTIERYQGTVCYLPNFGFEVMAKAETRRRLSSMRRWISCSEPTYAETLRRFAERTGTPPEKISTCYAMAENVFAVSQSDGFKTICVDDVERVSCGKPVDGTEVKLVEGEIWVKSPYSLKSYSGGADLCDEAGFYPTGDLGLLVQSEIVVTGRKRDMLNCAGKKFFLNDFDYAANEVLPFAKGRVASLAAYDSSLGTEVPLIVIEHERFWEIDCGTEQKNAIAGRVGFEQIEMQAVPPKFITKSSSGKVNRVKTLADFDKVRDFHSQNRATAVRDPSAMLARIRELFSGFDMHVPLEEHFDSLGRVVLKSVLEQHGYAAGLDDPSLTLAQILEREEVQQAQNTVVSIVSIGDRNQYQFINEDWISQLSRVLGLPLVYEHVCVPPAPILFSDLIFHDWFMPRDAQSAKYGPFSACINKLKQASLVIADDINHLHFPLNNDAFYPRISHRFVAEPLSELIAVRWARYTSNHHLIACEAVRGDSFDPISVNRSLIDLANYLQCDLMRLALNERYADVTADWEFLALHTNEYLLINQAVFPQEQFLQAMAQKLFNLHRQKALKFVPGDLSRRAHVDDQAHFCSWLANPAAVEYVLNRYDSFCVCGLESSIPYLSRRLRELDKRFFYEGTLTPARSDYDCMLQTGSWGMPEVGKPIYDLMAADIYRGKPVNVPEDEENGCPKFKLSYNELAAVFNKFAQVRDPVL